METRRLIAAVLVTMAVVILYQYAYVWIGEKLGYDMRRQPTTQPVVQAPETGPATAPVVAASSLPPSSLRVAPAATQPATPVRLGSSTPNDPNYRMAVELSPEGAAIDAVILNEFTRAVKSKDPYIFQEPFSQGPSDARALATGAIELDGKATYLSDTPWSLDSSDESSATFSTTLADESGPVLRLVKTYKLLPRSDESRGYEIAVTQSVQNLTGSARTVRMVMNGPLTPPPEVDRGPDRYMVAGYDYDPKTAKFQGEVVNHAIEAFGPDKKTIDLTNYEQYPAQWAGLVSVYFNAIARPIASTDPQAIAAPMAKIEAVAFDPDAQPHERHAAIRFETANVELQPNQSAAFALRVFFGPRQRTLLKEDYYASMGFAQTLVLTSGFCGICTFQWLIDLLVLLLRFFHMITRDWGLAIICLVVLVRAILHPITKKSQISMMKMAKLGPEMQRLKEKYADNKDELNKAMIDFHKQQGLGPYLGCLPMFLQMPIWIALWSALYSTFELRHASFLWGFTWIDDLAKPDHLIVFDRTYSLFFLHISGINLLPILMGVVFYLQMKMQPKPAAMTKEQEQQQKIMLWMMPVLFPLMLYSGPSGLNLYIMTSTLIGIIESKIIRDHIKKREDDEAQKRVIVDAKPTRGSKNAKRTESPDPPRKGGWLSRLQDWADQQRREQERRGK